MGRNRWDSDMTSWKSHHLMGEPERMPKAKRRELPSLLELGSPARPTAS